MKDLLKRKSQETPKNKCGPGGAHCPCCQPNQSNRKLARRSARRSLKLDLKKES